MASRRRLGTAAAILSCCSYGCARTEPPDAPADETTRPNIVFIFADDLGYGELGTYGQDKIRTPSLDRLAEEGMRFTDHYAGSPVCAPSRYSLLTGRHSGHAYIRDNDEMNERGDVWHDPELEGQRPMPESTVTVGHVLQDAGYRTAAIGKWGLGWVGSSGDPNSQGFDHFYGYICQRIAHNYYPTHLWRNGEKEPLDNDYFYPHEEVATAPADYTRFAGPEYAMDRLTDDAIRFLRESKDEPFFLYVPYLIPHLALQVPGDSLAEYADAFDETPYLGDQGYLPHPTPRAAYAAMITRMDRDVGRILAELDALGLSKDTVVVFSSDNGPSWVGGVDREFFDSSGGLRGRKAQLYEGGIRVPLVARWPERIPAGSTSDFASASWDLLPTFAALASGSVPEDVDGISLLPTLLGNSQAQAPREFLYWEFQRAQALRTGRFKAFRTSVDSPIELYDLENDPAETTDISNERQDVVSRARELMEQAHTHSELFPIH